MNHAFIFDTRKENYGNMDVRRIPRYAVLIKIETFRSSDASLINESPSTR